MNTTTTESGATDVPYNTTCYGSVQHLQNQVKSASLTKACWTWDPIPQALASEGTSPNYPLASSGGPGDLCPFLAEGSIDFYEAALFWQTTATDEVVSLRAAALKRGYYHWFWRKHTLTRDADGHHQAFFTRPDVARFGLSEFSVNVQLVQASHHPVLMPLPAGATGTPTELTHAK